jgi:RimJ/RimL family protein N-acetyltransferase
VVVRFRVATDLPSIAAVSHDTETVRWMSDEPMDEAASESSLDRVAESFRSGKAAPLVIADAETDEPVGLVNLQFRNDDVASVAYSVFPARRGEGIAGRSVQLVTSWATDELGVKELLLEIDPANLSSIRVAEKCGFVRSADSDGDSDGKAIFVCRL